MLVRWLQCPPCVGYPAVQLCGDFYKLQVWDEHRGGFFDVPLVKSFEDSQERTLWKTENTSP